MKEEFRSPALKNLNRAIYTFLPNITKSELTELVDKGDIDSLRLIGTFCVQCAPEGEFRDASESSLKAAMECLEALQHKYPQEKQKLHGLALSLLNIGFSMGLGNGLALHKQQQKKMTSLIKKNKAATSNQEIAQKLATDMWAGDKDQLIRTTDMADKVYREMAKMDLEKPLPDTLERVKQWIRPVAPDHAKRRGPSKRI